MALSGLGILSFDIANQFLQTVQFELVNELHLLAQLPFWEAFVVVPDDVVFGQVYKETPFVFSERHFGMRELNELLLVFIHWDGRANDVWSPNKSSKAHPR